MLFSRNAIFFGSALLLLMLSCGKPTVDSGPINTKDSLFIFVMAGQSNMAGRGMVEAQDTVTDPRIYTIDLSGNLAVAQEPLHLYQPGFTGLDCGMTFANTLLPYLPKGTRICLVPCAMSSSSIQDWLNDSVNGLKLYSNLRTRTATALQYGVLKGILWHQGEANAESPARALNYDADLATFIKKIRLDLQSEQLPFFAATLAPFCARPLKESINESLYKTAATMSNVYVISSIGLSGKSDSIHFDAPGQRGLGQRFADVVRWHWR